MVRELFNLFDHKYPTENLHELDLSWVIKDVQQVEAILLEWEQVIDELREDLKHLAEIDARLDNLETITSGLDEAYEAIAALKIEVGQNVTDIERLEAIIENFSVHWDETIGLLSEYARQLVKSEEIKRKSADNDLDVKIEKLRNDTNEGFEILYQLITQLVPTDVYNPIRGIRETLDKNNADVYGDLRYGGFTNAELSEYGVSNEHVASLVHNNRDYALHAKKRFRRHWLYSPFSGRWMPHQNAISEVYVFGFGGASNSDFYGAIAADSKTNDDLADYIESNQARYAFTL